MATRELSVREPLRPMLRPLTLAWGRFRSDGWWRSFRTGAGPATLRVHRTGERVAGEAWGPGADWVLERLPDLLGEGDPGGFAPDHPLIDRLHRRHGSRFGKTGLVTEAVMWAVIGQKVTGKEAGRGLRGVTRRFSEPAPGPEPRLWLPPDPERIAAAPYHAFHDLGIEKKRADALRRVANARGRLDETAGRVPVEAGRVIRSVPGVGPWTTAETLVVSHGDVDVVSVGDYHLKHLVSWHLAGEERGTDERMLALLEPFRPHRARVIRLLETLDGYPRRGPRVALRDFASH